MELLARRMKSGLKNAELPISDKCSWAGGCWTPATVLCVFHFCHHPHQVRWKMNPNPKASSTGEKQYSAGRAESGMEMVFSFTAAEAASYS